MVIMENALQVPRTALFRGQQGQWEAFKVVEGQALHAPVTVGLMNDCVAEVLTGREADGQVIMAPESTFTNGMRVASQPAEG